MKPMLGASGPVESGDSTWVVVVLIGAAVLVIGVGGVMVGRVAGLWFISRKAGAPVTLPRLLAMRMRGVDARAVVRARVVAASAKLEVPLEELERHAAGGGDPVRVVGAMVSARSTGTGLGWRELAEADRQGRDVNEVVREAVSRGGGSG